MMIVLSRRFSTNPRRRIYRAVDGGVTRVRHPQWPCAASGCAGRCCVSATRRRVAFVTTCDNNDDDGDRDYIITNNNNSYNNVIE